MFENLKTNDRAVVSIILLKKAEVWEIADLSKRVIIAKSLTKKGMYREFNRNTGSSVGGEKLLDEDDIAIKEAPEITCPHCGVPQINFFTAKEFMQGGKNLNCYQCGKLLRLDINGNVKKLLSVE